MDEEIDNLLSGILKIDNPNTRVLKPKTPKIPAPIRGGFRITNIRKSKPEPAKIPEKSELITATITRSGMLLNYDQISGILGSRFQELLNKLTISFSQTLKNTTRTKYIKLYRIIIPKTGAKILSVARFSGIQKLLSEFQPGIQIRYENKITSGIDISSRFRIPESGSKNSETNQETKQETTQGIHLKDYQEVCLDYLLEEVYSPKKAEIGTASCIFVMDTGLGKTFISAALIEKLKQKTLIIIPNTSNLPGWTEPFEKYLKNLKLGFYYSKVKKDGDVVIMVINSAMSDEFEFPDRKVRYWDYFKEFGLVIFDEIHDFPTGNRKDIFWRTGFRFSIALTATPDERLDGMDTVYYKHLGPIVVAQDIPGVSELISPVRFKGSVRVIKYYGPPEFTETKKSSMDTVCVPEMQKQFAMDPYRNQLALDLILEKYRNGRSMFVFAEHRDILNEFYNIILEKLKSDPEIRDKMTTFMGGFDQESQRIAYNSANIVFTTYRFGKQSISIPRMDAILLLQPIRNKMRQTIGRILRIGGNPEIHREIIDIRDMNTSLKSQFSTRKQIYQEKEFPISAETVMYSDIRLSDFQIPEKIETKT